ncbi:hypothetical protein TNCV_703001 [Trichonephila clavipes]|nr:hypothetical protein TNCV_703001 [Trichonephila clavipes]
MVAPSSGDSCNQILTAELILIQAPSDAKYSRDFHFAERARVKLILKESFFVMPHNHMIYVPMMSSSRKYINSSRDRTRKLEADMLPLSHRGPRDGSGQPFRPRVTSVGEVGVPRGIKGCRADAQRRTSQYFKGADVHKDVFILSTKRSRFTAV